MNGHSIAYRVTVGEYTLYTTDDLKKAKMTRDIFSNYAHPVKIMVVDTTVCELRED